MSDEISGTRRIYRIDPNGLAQIRRWLDGFWDAALTSFQNEVDRQLEKEKERKS